MRVNLADPGPSFGDSRGQRPQRGWAGGHGGSWRMVLLGQQGQKAAGHRWHLSPTRPRWVRTSRGQAGPCAASY